MWTENFRRLLPFVKSWVKQPNNAARVERGLSVSRSGRNQLKFTLPRNLIAVTDADRKQPQGF